jgi:hypothetical protein
MVEIILKQYNLDEAINAAIAAPNTKADTINKERQQAQEAAERAIVEQFRKELNTFLDASFIDSLNPTISPTEKLDVFEVQAIFKYKGEAFSVSRDDTSWCALFDHKKVNCTGEELQNALLVELAVLREHLKHQEELLNKPDED